MEDKYNLVTQELLLAGYTAENHPDYVRIPSGVYGKSPLDNIYGGFEYTQDFLNKKAFRTGCGLIASEFPSATMLKKKSPYQCPYFDD